MNLLRRRDGVSRQPREAPAPPPDDGLKASAMRGTEPLYGYVVALELVVVGILNLTVTSGKGAPAHPSTALAGVGVAAGISLFGFLQTKNRVLVAFAVIAAAFLVDLPKVPNSLQLAHVFSLALPFAYSLVLTQRHRKRMKTELVAARSRRSAAPARTRPNRKEKGAVPTPSAPRASGRYTPPKAQRSKRR
jgi:hypothetical protein